MAWHEARTGQATVTGLSGPQEDERRYRVEGQMSEADRRFVEEARARCEDLSLWHIDAGQSRTTTMLTEIVIGGPDDPAAAFEELDDYRRFLPHALDLLEQAWAKIEDLEKQAGQAYEDGCRDTGIKSQSDDPMDWTPRNSSQ